MRKILVTGGIGHIGSNVIDSLLSQEYSVIVLDNLLTGIFNNLFCIMKKIYNYNYEANCLPECEVEIKGSILSNKKGLSLFGDMSLMTIDEELKMLYSEGIYA